MRSEDKGRIAMGWKSRGGGGEAPSRSLVSKKSALLLCIGSFFAGLLFTNIMWMIPEANDMIMPNRTKVLKIKLLAGGSDSKTMDEKRETKDIIEVSKTHHDVQMLDKTISNLETELASARAAQESILNTSPISEDLEAATESSGRRKYVMVVGINTAFSSRKRRDSVRVTWMPRGEKRKKMEEEKGIIIRFVIGHSATSGGILDKAIEAEDRKHGDFMRLVEGYNVAAYMACRIMLKDTSNYQPRQKYILLRLSLYGMPTFMSRLMMMYM